MKAEYINPFLESVDQLFSNMLGSQAKRGALGTSRGLPAGFEITALIGPSGPAKGTVALSFPTQTAAAMVGRLLGSQPVDASETLIDGVAELVNIIAGNAKAKLSAGLQKPIDLSLPTVIRGKNFQFQGPSQALWLDIPFVCDMGEFCVRVTFAD